MFLKKILFSALLLLTKGFIQPNFPSGIRSTSLITLSATESSPENRIYIKKINGAEINVYEPANTIPSETPCVYFFTGANNFIPSDIYSTFLTSLSSKGVSIHCFNNYQLYKNKEVDTDILETSGKDYSNITYIGHSTGCVNTLKLSSPKNKVILIDPVDNTFLFDLKEKLADKIFDLGLNASPNNLVKDMNNKDIMILNFKKSYEWKVLPPTMPFIFTGKMEFPKTTKVTEIKNYGHCDILDKKWSDFMDSTVSKGFINRDDDEVYKIHDIVSDYVKDFINTIEEPLNNDETEEQDATDDTPNMDYPLL